MANTKVTGDLIANGTITAANLVTGALDGILSTYLSTNAYATQSYVTTAVNNLIDAAPASLDTLNELAAALNDDANFATTVTNSLATKLNLSGGNITGNLSVDTDVLFVDAANNRVGIGTSSPGAKLHSVDSSIAAKFEVSALGGVDFSRENDVGNNSNHYILSFKNADSDIAQIQTINRTGAVTSTGTGYELRLNAVGSGYQTFYTNGSERMRITSTGDVGIGTGSPDSKLQVGSLGYFRVYPANSPTPAIINMGYELDYSQIRTTNYGGNLILSADTPSRKTGTYIGFDIDGSERMRVDSGGNVGIGTSSVVNSRMQINTSGTSNSQVALRLRNPNGNGGTGTSLYFQSGYSDDISATSAITGYRDGAGNTSFLTFSTVQSGPSLVERMRITSAGNVGIGTTAPGAKLTVQGDIQTQTFKTFFYGEAGGQTRSILTVATDNTSGVAYLEIIYNRNNSNLRGARKFSALTHWYGSTKGAVQVNADISVDININPPTVSWSGNVLQITIDTTANGGALIVNASANYRSGTPFTWS